MQAETLVLFATTESSETRFRGQNPEALLCRPPESGNWCERQTEPQPHGSGRFFVAIQAADAALRNPWEIRDHLPSPSDIYAFLRADEQGNRAWRKTLNSVAIRR
jgi:hypothetical protein